MGIMTRIARLCKADIHGVIDQLEDQGLLLKQHLRDMEDALSQKEVRLKKMLATRQQAQQELDKHKQQNKKLEQDLEMAIKRSKDDIARTLIKRLKPLSRLQSEISDHIASLDQEIIQFKDHLEQQRLLYEQLKHKAAEYFHRVEMRGWEKNLSGTFREHISAELSEEEVELELIQRKEALKGGGVS